MLQPVKQILWSGEVYAVPLNIKSKVEILGINKTVRPLSTLRCVSNLTYDNGQDVVVCEDCVNIGITSPLSYTVWNPVTEEHYHALEYDVLILCNGMKNHVSTTCTLILVIT